MKIKKIKPVRVSKNGTITIPPGALPKFFTQRPTIAQLADVEGGECFAFDNSLYRVTGIEQTAREKIIYFNKNKIVRGKGRD